jgi:hypothetical protein
MAKMDALNRLQAETAAKMAALLNVTTGLQGLKVRFDPLWFRGQSWPPETPE